MNNLDVIILIIIAVSALIALNRGLIKEVLSIIGWILGLTTVISLLPYVQPFMEKRIESQTMAMVASSFAILILFFVVWIYLTSFVISKVRSSKLSGMDRVLGLFFGVIRAFLLIVLLNILIGWMIPVDSQPDSFKQSKYYQLAGTFAEPIEKLLPEAAREQIHQSAALSSETETRAAKGEKEGELDMLFDKLTQPQIKKKETSEINSEVKGEKDKSTKDTKSGSEIKTNDKSYNNNEQMSLDRLIEMTVQE